MEKNVAKKLFNIQQTLDAPKDLYNKFGGYAYRSAESILQALKKPLFENQCVLVVSDSVEFIGDNLYIKATAKLIDTESGEEIASTAFAREAPEKKGMDCSQVTGATSSYARKYALNALFAIDDNKDFDTDEAHRMVNGDSAPKKESTPKKEAVSAPSADDVQKFIERLKSVKTANEFNNVWKSNPAMQKDSNVVAVAKEICDVFKKK